MKTLIILGITACLSTSAIALIDNWQTVASKLDSKMVLKIEQNHQIVNN